MDDQAIDARATTEKITHNDVSDIVVQVYLGHRGDDEQMGRIGYACEPFKYCRYRGGIIYAIRLLRPFSFPRAESFQRIKLTKMTMFNDEHRVCGNLRSVSVFLLFFGTRIVYNKGALAYISRFLSDGPQQLDLKFLRQQ